MDALVQHFPRVLQITLIIIISWHGIHYKYTLLDSIEQMDIPFSLWNKNTNHYPHECVFLKGGKNTQKWNICDLQSRHIGAKNVN